MTRESIKSIIKQRICLANEITDEWYEEDRYKEEKSAIFKVVLQKLLEPLNVVYESEENKKTKGEQ